MPKHCRGRRPTGDAAPSRDVASRSVMRGRNSDLDLRLIEIVAGRAEAGDDRTRVRERVVQLDEQFRRTAPR